MKRKKKRKGFTTYELLIVVTILVILILIAIPIVNKIIENVRRDAFANLAQSYINSVKTAVLTDDLKCTNDFGVTWVSLADVPNSHHCYFNIQTAEGSTWEQQTIDIMESAGKSPWGSLDVTGTIRFYKEIVEVDGLSETKYHYLIRLKDTAGHGTPGTTFIKDYQITRKSIVTSGSRADISLGTASNPSHRPYLCYLS